MTEVEDVLLLGPDIREKVQFDKRLITQLGAAMWAFVAPNHLVHGLARMYQSLADDLPIHIEAFRDLDSAEAWLTRR